MPPHPVGLDLIRKVQAVQGGDRRTLLAFSNGKDGIAAWLAIRDHFEVVPYYLGIVPGLEFIEQSLDYYERLFGAKIIRLVHPAFWRMLNSFVYQPPTRVDLIQGLRLTEPAYRTLTDDIRKSVGWPAGVLTATGLRIADNMLRRIAIKKHGPISTGAKNWYPIWDWSIDHMVTQFRRAGVKLPIDYRMFGRSFDGLAGYYLVPIKKYFPRDFQRICEFFPLAEAEYRRHVKWGRA